jgi:hypothetical protein
MPNISGAGSGSVVSFPSNPEFKEYLVKRDKDRPLSFEGQRLAHTSDNGGPLMMGSFDCIEGSVYRTRGGKYITSLSKSSLLETLSGSALEMVSALADTKRPATGGYNKAAVHDSFEDAMNWFKPGRITDAIRKQLGLDKPLRIE